MAKKRFTRRDFIKTAAAGAFTAGLGAPLILPGRSHGAAAKKTLKILHWVHFVPAYDKWFNEKYIKEWGEKNNTEVTVDNIGLARIEPLARLPRCRPKKAMISSSLSGRRHSTRNKWLI